MNQLTQIEKPNENNFVERDFGQTSVVSRQSAEVQGAIFMAKKFPRDELKAEQKILTACKRKSLAETAVYEYPRGGQKVSGPSIRLAEVLAQNWGNIDFGIIELEKRPGKSTMMAYAWDLETNTRQTKVFQVDHSRTTRTYGTQAVTDPRDIYEVTANQGARRMRACILGVIPGDIVESAVKECQKTLIGKNPIPLKDRILNMLEMFQNSFQVSKEMIEKRLGCKAESISELQIITLGNIFNGMKDGMSKREDWFDISPEKTKKGSKAKSSLDSNSEEVENNTGGFE